MIRLVFLLVVFAPNGYAQTGTLVGRVVEAASGQGLPGANVHVVGTQLGGATNRDGWFRILDVPVGEYTVEGRFVGFESYTIPSVRVHEGAETAMRFALSALELFEDPVLCHCYFPLFYRDAFAPCRIFGGSMDTCPCTCGDIRLDDLPVER